ncbi:16101_t:CDS:2 [Racocetra fulgida]|uniref:16101_t:CDS:1 n=1 Tax=Racocetra fulgida TaxID=60492 RepID=A0A9N9HEU3_9GLOM|nr:16101_t:CDS:2 [Racocetra fulgida]
MSQANTKYLEIRKRALRDFEKALEFSLKKFNDIQKKDKHIAMAMNQLRSSFERTINSLNDHFSDYESPLNVIRADVEYVESVSVENEVGSSRSSETLAMLNESLAISNNVEVGTSSGSSKAEQNNKTKGKGKKRQGLLNETPTKNMREDLPKIPIIYDLLFGRIATGYHSNNESWEILEYLEDIVYEPKHIEMGVKSIATNKSLAAYSLVLGLHKLNQMKFLAVNKRIADAFEAYFGAYYLVYGELLTCIYLDSLMTPLLDLILEGTKSSKFDIKYLYEIASQYFSMMDLRLQN